MEAMAAAAEARKQQGSGGGVMAGTKVRGRPTQTTHWACPLPDEAAACLARCFQPTGKRTTGVAHPALSPLLTWVAVARAGLWRWCQGGRRPEQERPVQRRVDRGEHLRQVPLPQEPGEPGSGGETSRRRCSARDGPTHSH